MTVVCAKIHTSQKHEENNHVAEFGISKGVAAGRRLDLYCYIVRFFDPIPTGISNTVDGRVQ